MSGVALGIDLGTTNSTMAAMINSNLAIIPNANGERLIPSVVSFTTSSGILVGTAAKNNAEAIPHATVSSVKRIMGKSAVECESQAFSVPYRIVSGPDKRAAVTVDGKMYYPEEISAHLLSYLKKEAECYLQEKIEKAVITVPAHFDSAQREATRKAGELAGLEVIKLLDEPYASALAYGLDQKGRTSRILVFDLGGGTLDISVLELSRGTFMACSLSGDVRLGGDDWNACIVDSMANDFLDVHGIDLRMNPPSLRLLIDAAEKAKIELSSKMSVRIVVPCAISDAKGPLSVDCSLSRQEFEIITASLLKRCESAICQALANCELNARDIDEIVLVGGSSQIPAVRTLIGRIFGRNPRATVNPNEVVALGAALQGAIMENRFKGAWLIDATSLSPEMRAYAHGVIVTSGWWKEPF